MMCVYQRLTADLIIATKRLKQKGKSDNGSVNDYYSYSLFISKTILLFELHLLICMLWETSCVMRKRETILQIVYRTPIRWRFFKFQVQGVEYSIGKGTYLSLEMLVPH